MRCPVVACSSAAIARRGCVRLQQQLKHNEHNQMVVIKDLSVRHKDRQQQLREYILYI